MEDSAFDFESTTWHGGNYKNARIHRILVMVGDSRINYDYANWYAWLCELNYELSINYGKTDRDQMLTLFAKLKKEFDALEINQKKTKFYTETFVNNLIAWEFELRSMVGKYKLDTSTEGDPRWAAAGGR